MNKANGEPSSAAAAAAPRHPVDVMRDLERAEADLAMRQAALERTMEGLARAQAHRAALALEIRPVLEREGPLICDSVVRWIDPDGLHQRMEVRSVWFVPQLAWPPAGEPTPDARTPPDHDDLSEASRTAAELAELRSC